VVSLALNSYFTSSISYFAQSQFLVTILHFCLKATLIPAMFNDRIYYVSDPTLDIAFPLWTSNIPGCEPTKYEVEL